MNSSDFLKSFGNQLLTTQNRALDLVWPSSVADRLRPVLLPQRAFVSEGICSGILARIACLTTNARLPMNLFTGMPVALSMTIGHGASRLFPMIVADASITRSSTQGLHAVNLVGRDPLHFMDQKRRLRTWRDRAVQDVVADVLGEWVNHSPLGASFDFKFLLAQADRYPRRACHVQHPDESDAQLVQRLLRANGMAWAWQVRDGEEDRAQERDGVPQLRLTIFDDGHLLAPNPSPSMRYHRRDGIQGDSTIDLLVSLNRLTPSGGTLDSWDHEAAILNTAAGIAGMRQGDAGDDLAAALHSTRYAVDHLGNDSSDLERLAQVQADAQVFRAHGLRGRSGIVSMAPATYQCIEDYPPFEGLNASERNYLAISVEHAVENDLPATLHHAAQALAGDGSWPSWVGGEDDKGGEGAQRVDRYANMFYCVPRRTPIVPSYIEERDAPARRRLAGIVIAESGGEISCDELGRVKVRLLGGAPGADTTAWVRNPTPWGGKDHGYIGVLRAGTEVGVEQVGPDRLVICAVYFNGKTPPPQFDHVGRLPSNAAQSGFVSREIGGDRTQQLRFLDQPGDISVQLGTDHGATQVNIGSIATPMIDGKTEPRGEGAEVRSDKNVALRSAEAMLLSAWSRLKAAGQAMDSSEHQALMQDFIDLFASLGDYAAQHQGQPVDIRAASQLKAAVQVLREPTVSITAPDGIASTTPKAIASYAGENIDAVAMQHMQQTAGGRHVVNAGKGVSVFAQEGGISTIAHHGKLLMQSQHEATQIDAATDIKLSAAGGRLVGMARSEIVLMVEGGTYLKLSNAGIELGSQKPLRVRTAGHHWDGPATLGGELPAFGEGEFGRVPRLVRPTDGKPVPGAGLQVHGEDGSIAAGSTDGAGKGPQIVANGLRRLKSFFFFPRD